MVNCLRCGDEVRSYRLYRTPMKWVGPARPCGKCYAALRAVNVVNEARRKCARCAQSFPVDDLRSPPGAFYAKAKVCAFCWTALSQLGIRPEFFKLLMNRASAEELKEVPPPRAPLTAADRIAVTPMPEG